MAKQTKLKVKIVSDDEAVKAEDKRVLQIEKSFENGTKFLLKSLKSYAFGCRRLLDEAKSRLTN